MSRILLAHAAAATAAIGGGSAVVVTRMVIGETDPVSLAFFRYAIGALCMLPVLFAAWPRGGLTGGDWVKVAALGALFFGLFPWSFSAGLEITTAARGAVWLATMPMQTLIVAVLVGREVLTRNKLIGVLLALAGVAVMFGPEAFASGNGLTLWSGDLLLLFTAFCAAVYSVFSRRTLERLGALFATALAMLFGVLSLAGPGVAVGTFDGWPEFTGRGWFLVIFLGTAGGAVQFTLFTWALRWLDPSRVTIYLSLIPVTAMVLAVLLLGESLTLPLVIGLALALSAVAVANRPGRRASAPAS